MAHTKRTQTKKAQTKKEQTKKGGMMSFLRKMRSQTANAESPVSGFGIMTENGEMIPENGNPLLTVPKLPFQNNNYRPTNATIIGVGSTKTVWVSPREKKWAFMNSNPEQMKDYTKQDMINDYLFSLKLHHIDAGFFPEVVAQWMTPRKLVYKKELCQQINNEMLNAELLNNIIEAAQLLMDKYLLFTFDLKPANVGILDDNINFIDFGLENSYKLVNSATPDTKKNYVAFSILILLVFCWFHTTMSHTELRELAQLHIPIKKYIRAFKRFNNAMKLKVDIKTKPPIYSPVNPEGYHQLFDPNIDVKFNFPKFNPDVVDPSIVRMIVEPYQFLEAYGRKIMNDEVRKYTLDEIVNFLY
jgi:hypothetical protein